VCAWTDIHTCASYKKCRMDCVSAAIVSGSDTINFCYNLLFWTLSVAAVTYCTILARERPLHQCESSFKEKCAQFFTSVCTELQEKYALLWGLSLLITHMYIAAHTRTLITYTQTSTRIHAPTPTYAPTHIYTHTCTHTHLHPHMHPHERTHTLVHTHTFSHTSTRT